MMTPVQYSFGDFRVDVKERRLMCSGEVVHIEPKSFDVLCYLLESAGHLATKDDLVAAVWRGGIASDNSLTRCVHQVRTALGDDADSPSYIETVAGTGYRFVAAVDIESDPDLDPEFVAAPPSTLRRRFTVALAMALLLAVTVFTVMRPPVPATPTIERLAILPLENLTGDPGQEYFVQGVHDALIAELSRIRTIEVISRTSVLQYSGTKLPIPEIARQLQVDAVLEGTVLRAGEKLTLTAQLIATEPERHIWAERYHRDVDELFEITTDITSAIAREIAVELEPVDTAVETRSEVYDVYLQARFQFEQRTSKGYRAAAAGFQQAITMDPDFAPAYVGLAHTQASPAIFGAVAPAAAFPRARELAERAKTLDPHLAEAHLLLGGVAFYWDGDTEAAEQQVRYALTINPSLANGYRLLSEVLSVSGEHTAAFTAVERGRALDPLPPVAQFKPALILYLARDFDAALRRTREAMSSYPAFWQGHWLECVSLSALGRHLEALPSCRKAVELSGGMPMATGVLGQVLAHAGNHTEARRLVDGLRVRSEQSYTSKASLAMVLAALGDREAAFAYLEQATQERDQLLVHIQNAAYFDVLRNR